MHVACGTARGTRRVIAGVAAATYADRMKTIRIALAAALALTAGYASAAGMIDPRVDDLRDARDRLTLEASRSKGAQNHRMLQERDRVNRMIDDLENGRALDPDDIDRALQRAEQPLAEQPLP
jgi:Tfp pilus assembly protein FimV